MTKEQIRKDFAAYADDDANILIESSGEVMFTKNGKEHICKITTSTDSGLTNVEFNGRNFSYREFIAKELARLDVLASRIVEKRQNIDGFVDGAALLKTYAIEESDTCLKLLEKECSNNLEFSTKVVFITADAGHGKTALLKEFQFQIAKKYLSGESNYLFWHVDLQGRDLVRLPEAIMYDLGELRIPGLYFSSIVNLLKNRFIVLAIDGFDELAAEIGGTSALGALSSLVAEMEGQGTLIAASRRTFFDTQDYLKRTKFLKSNLSADCEFDEIKIKNWGQYEAIQYFSYYFDNPGEVYREILIELSNDAEHPILTRPFLLTKVSEILSKEEYRPVDFFNNINREAEGVAAVVEAFTKREVEKWKERDKQTGKPYLTYDQHISLLSVIAKEMWEAQKDEIAKEEVQFYTTILLEQWRIEENLKPLIIRMVESHAFLLPVSDSKFQYRRFEHEEFRNYFLARSLANLINSQIQVESHGELKKFLSINQLPDSVAKYCINYVDDLNTYGQLILDTFEKMIEEEWKPSYLQLNIGTLFPFILDNLEISTKIAISAKVSYSSLVFENKAIKNIIFENATFINISIRNTVLTDIEFKNCTFTEIKIDLDSKNVFSKIIFNNCTVNCITLISNNEIIETAYSPVRIFKILDARNILITPDLDGNISTINGYDNEVRKLVNKFLIKFNKTIYQYQVNIEREKPYGEATQFVINHIIPIMIRYNLVEEKETQVSRFINSIAWRLNFSLDEIFSKEGINDGSNLSNFWKEIYRLRLS